MGIFFGKMPKRRSRHIKSQMKFFSGGRYKSGAANSMWGFANKQAKRYGKNSWTGIN